MAKSKMTSDPLPDEFQTIEEAAEFWDTHSLADYEDLQQEAAFEVELRSETNYFAIEKDLSAIIDQLARSQGVLPETLVNLWLKEKVLELQKTGT